MECSSVTEFFRGSDVVNLCCFIFFSAIFVFLLSSEQDIIDRSKVTQFSGESDTAKMRFETDISAACVLDISIDPVDLILSLLSEFNLTNPPTSTSILSLVNLRSHFCVCSPSDFHS